MFENDYVFVKYVGDYPSYEVRGIAVFPKYEEGDKPISILRELWDRILQYNKDFELFEEVEKPQKTPVLDLGILPDTLDSAEEKQKPTLKTKKKYGGK